MNPSLKIFLAATVAVSLSLFETADAHGYLKSPRSRNYYAHAEAIYWKATENDPLPESDPQSLNRGGVSAQCGMINGRNYDLPKNALGGLMKATVQECYEEGSVIDLKVFLTAHHGGHFEFYACPIAHGKVPTESCFKDHPLEFVEDLLNNAPKDPNYPTRAYLPQQTTSGLGEFNYKYKLPVGLLGELVLIQWYYVTGNTCVVEGYANYPFPVGFTAYNEGTTTTCPLPITGDGSEAPERFWNCAEVRITEDCSVTTTSTTTYRSLATVCTPITTKLPNGITPVSQESCDSCAAGYQWWPCNHDPPLCDCINPQTTSTTPVPSPTAPSQIVCSAYTQEELNAMGGGLSAVTDGDCVQCGPPLEYQWWPCNSNLCKCDAGNPVSAPVTTSTTTTSSTVMGTTGNAIMPTPQPTPNPTNMMVAPTAPSPTESGFVQLVKVASTTQKVYDTLERVKGRIDSEVFLYETPTGAWKESSVYRFTGLKGGLEVMHEVGVANSYIYLGDGSDIGHIIGLVNVAAFIAQSMKETIKYDACDENSWDLIGGVYPLSNACGQLGQSYQDYHCSEEEKHMECEVDPNMSITAKTHAKWYGAPAPLFCRPKTGEMPFTGKWDYTYHCNNPWKDPPDTCDVYEGQQAGRFDNSAPVENGAQRIDVEGCCWWGRGVIQTTGVCNFGKLNYFLGARAAVEGRSSRYPTVDFCKDPEAICASEEHQELKWVAGLFYWQNSLQAYRERGWDYLTELHKFVENGMNDGDSFINSVSGIVNRGCFDPPCNTGAVDGLSERAANFKKVLSIFLSPATGSTPAPTPQPIGTTTTTSTILAPTTTITSSATLPPTNVPSPHPSANPVTAPPAQTCVAYSQEELNAFNEGGWATSDAQCAQCAYGYKYWPCNASPTICKCGTAPTPTPPSTTTTAATTTTTTMTTVAYTTTSATATTSSTSSTQVPLQQHDKTIVAYYASWQWYDRAGLAKPTNMDFTKVQRVNFAFFQTDTDGNLFGTDSWADPNTLFGPYNWNPQQGANPRCSWDSVVGGEVQKACNFHYHEQGLIHLVHAAGAVIYPSIGGWTLSDQFPAMAASAEARANFANNCVKLIQEYDFDGIDIDWEYPGYEEHSGTANDTANFKLLLNDVRAKLNVLEAANGRRYGLTAALPCGPNHIANMDIAHTASVLSELNLMTYDFHGSWDATTGFNAPLYYQGWGNEEFNLHSCVENWLAGGGTRDKINIGLPFYGRSFLSATGLNQPHGGSDTIHWQVDDGTPQYFNIVSKLGEMTQEWDETTWTQWAYFNDEGGLVSFDNKDAICAKTEFVQQHNLNGFIIWELSGDLMADLSTPLLDALNEKLLNPDMSCGGTGEVVTKPLFGEPTTPPTSVAPTGLPPSEPTSLPTQLPTNAPTFAPTHAPTPISLRPTPAPTHLAVGQPCVRGSDCSSGICASNGEDAVVCFSSIFCR